MVAIAVEKIWFYGYGNGMERFYNSCLMDKNG